MPTAPSPEHEPPTTVVLVHGAMDRAASFGRVMRRLGDLDVVAYDRRGYAGSLGAGVAPDIETHLADLADVAAVDPCGSTGRGGPQPRWAARTAGRRAATCLYRRCRPWARSRPRCPGSKQTSTARARQPWRSHGARDPSAAAEFFFRAMVGDAVWARLRETERKARLAEGPALVSELAAVRDPHAEFTFDHIDAAVHVARGERSPRRLRAAAERMAQITGTACEVVMGSGHGAHLTHPDEFARWVRSVAAAEMIGAPESHRAHRLRPVRWRQPGGTPGRDAARR